MNHQHAYSQVADWGKDTPPMLKVLKEGPAEQANELMLSLDELAREGVRRMLAAALEAEASAYVRAVPWRARCGREGPGRAKCQGQVSTGDGGLRDDRGDCATRECPESGCRSRARAITSAIPPTYMRRSPTVAEVLPILYLRGLSTRDLREALETSLGKDAAGLSATNIMRLLRVWEEEYRRFQSRDLSDRDYVYVWTDGVHFNIRLEENRLCTLVIQGARS